MKLFIIAILFISAIAFAGNEIGEWKVTRKCWKAGDRSADFSTVYSASAVPIFTIEAKTAIRNVDAFVTTAVTATNDATAFIVGDGNDDDGYMTQGFADNTGPHANGYNSDAYRGAYLTKTATVDTIKYYSAADTMDITITTDSASPLLTGEICFDIEHKRFD